ncbi:MAG: DUF3592 domain-containing protein [Saprospiraceae bacterium]|jgi:hypothetical protein|nr:DUF3592 domain-containing protein [Saprospiraceae bacterium]
MNTFVQNILQFGPLASFFGAFLLILSYQKKHEIEHTIKKGKVTEGTVIEIREHQSRGFAPVVEFKTQNGLYKHYSSSFRFSCRYFVGQKVKIYYYIYRSRREFALEDDTPGTLPESLLKWGVVLCLIGMPMLIIKVIGLF